MSTGFQILVFKIKDKLKFFNKMNLFHKFKILTFDCLVYY